MKKINSSIIDKLPRITRNQFLERNKAVQLFNKIQKKFGCSIKFSDQVTKYIQPIPPVTIRYILEQRVNGKFINRLIVNHDDHGLVGRSSKLLFQIEDPCVSAVHCRIHQDGNGRLCLTDLGSCNGTKLNDLRISPFRKIYLSNNSVVSIGSTDLKIAGIENVSGSTGNLAIKYELSFDEKSDDTKETYIELSENESKHNFSFSIDSHSLILFALSYFSLDIPANMILLLPVVLRSTIIQGCLDSILRAFNQSNGSDWIAKISSKQFPGNKWEKIGIITELKLCRFNLLLNLGMNTGTFCELINTFFPDIDESDSMITENIDYFITASIVIARHRTDENELSLLKSGDTVMLGVAGRISQEVSYPTAIEISFGNPVNKCCIKAAIIIRDSEYCMRINPNEPRGENEMNGKVVENTGNSGVVSQLCETKLFNIADARILEATVELGRLHLSYREVAEMLPGSVLPMGIKVDDQISMRINDEIVATGNLVLIDDELGLEITEKAGWKNDYSNN